MEQKLQIKNCLDENLNPAGGSVFGTGIDIQWQNGRLVPMSPNSDRRNPPNGAFVEDVIDACIRRIEFYQHTKFNCEENQNALEYLRGALAQLESRTARRKAQGVEGSHEGN